MYRAKRRFGQNFLHDDYIIGEIIRIIHPCATDFIVEIGPGLAALTRPLLTYVNPLHVVEIDRDMIAYLKAQFGEQLIIHAADALRFDYSFPNVAKIRIVGNLPYNISTPLLFHLAQFNNIVDMHFMLQKEVVERICAKPDTHSYGRLTVMLQYRFDCCKMLDVAKECFQPMPQVESAIVRLVPKEKALWQDIDEKKLNLVVTKAFSGRRKTISNSLKNLISVATLQELGIDTKKRAENITVAEYIALSQSIMAVNA